MGTVASGGSRHRRARAGALVVTSVALVLMAALATPAPVGASAAIGAAGATGGQVVAPTTEPTTTTTTSTTSTTTSTTTVPTTVPLPTSTPSTVVPGPPGTDPVPTEPGEETTTTVDVPPVSIDVEANPELAELPPGELALIGRYLDAKAEARDLSDRIASLNAGIADTQTLLAAAQARVGEADRKVAEAEDRVGRVEAQLDAQQQRLQRHAVAAYIAGGDDDDTASALFHAGSVDDLGASLVYADAVVAEEQGLIRRTGALRDQLDAVQDAADAEAAAAQAARDEVAARDAELSRRRDELIATQQQLVLNAERQRSVLSEAAQRRLAVAEQLETQARLSDGIAGTLAARQAGQTPPAVIEGIFLSPLPNPRITSPFGARLDPLFGTVAGHPGIDINAATGTPIRAPADGTVVAAGWIDGYGNCTIIDHGSGLATLYGHQSSVLVADGALVKRGQTIGLVGSTGYSTGPHLHWEVRVLGKVVNPVPYIGEIG
jgi:murein DD-endopeptidase MepM/ murein hydrolase activator NlpD